jgi:hypothetical protein
MQIPHVNERGQESARRKYGQKNFDIHYLTPLPQCASLLGRWPRVNVYQLDLVTDKLHVVHMVLGDWVAIGIIKRDVIAGRQPGLQFAAIV